MRPLKNVHFCQVQERRKFYHPDEKSIGAGIHTLSISKINPPKFGGGLKFEPDPEK